MLTIRGSDVILMNSADVRTDDALQVVGGRIEVGRVGVKTLSPVTPVGRGNHLSVGTSPAQHLVNGWVQWGGGVRLWGKLGVKGVYPKSVSRTNSDFLYRKHFCLKVYC